MVRATSRSPTKRLARAPSRLLFRRMHPTGLQERVVTHPLPPPPRRRPAPAERTVRRACKSRGNGADSGALCAVIRCRSVPPRLPSHFRCTVRNLSLVRRLAQLSIFFCCITDRPHWSDRRGNSPVHHDKFSPNCPAAGALRAVATHSWSSLI